MKAPRNLPTAQASLALFVLAMVVFVSPLRFAWLRPGAPWWTPFVIGFGLVGVYIGVVFRKQDGGDG